MNVRLASLTAVLLAGILALALILRIWSVDFGLPYAYHIDERSYVVGALNLGQGEINGYPQQVGLVNLLFLEYAGFFLVGRLIGLFASVQDFARAYYIDPSVFYLLGRLTSVVLGVASCWAIYLLGKELRDRWVGLLAALLAAVNFLHVRESHFTTPDVAQALGFTVVAWLCHRTLRTNQPRTLYVASFLGGVVIAWKWASLPLILPLAFVAWQAGRGRSVQVVLKRWLICGVLVLLGFVISSPQLILFPTPYIEWARRDYITGSVGGYGGFLIDTVPGWVFYLKALWIGFGVLGLALAVAGLVLWAYRALWQRDRRTATLLLCFIGYFLLMSSSQRYFVRYAVPMIPFLALAAADAVYWASERWPANRRRESVAVTTILVLLATVQPALAAVRANMLWAREDTRTIAKLWVEQNIPSGAKIATDWMIHGVPLATLDTPSPYSTATYAVTEVNGLGLSDYPVEFYRDEGFDYLITTSYINRLELVDREKDRARKVFYRSLDSNFTLIYEIRPYDGAVEPPFMFDCIYGPLIALWQYDRPGPTLKIYQIDGN